MRTMRVTEPNSGTTRNGAENGLVVDAPATVAPTPNPAPAVAHPSPVHLRLEIDHTSPPAGWLRGDGVEVSFVGWMELLASIETALAEGSQTVAASSVL